MDKESLRKVAMYVGNRRYVLETWDTGKMAGTGVHARLGYRLISPEGVIFEAEDFGCSPLCAVDSDECLRGIMSFLTMKPGDTDRAYFDDYTPAQMAFAEGDAEYLQAYAIDPDELAGIFGEPFEEIEEEENAR